MLLDDLKRISKAVSFQKDNIDYEILKKQSERKKLELQERVLENIIDLLQVALEQYSLEESGIIVANKEVFITEKDDFELSVDSNYQSNWKSFNKVCEVTSSVCRKMGINYDFSCEDSKEGIDNLPGYYAYGKKVRQMIEVPVDILRELTAPSISHNIRKVLKIN